MIEVCLVRHGETDWNKDGRLQGQRNIPLNEVGIQQAKECLSVLKNKEWDIIITSPLRRARQTADIIQEEIHRPMVEMRDFVEMSFGEGEGMSLVERQAKFPKLDGYPGQESVESLHSRIMEGLHAITENYEGKKILLVAHGRVINDMLETFSKGSIVGRKIGLVNGCISNIYFDDGKWLIRDYNQTSHLTTFSESGRV